MRGSLLFGIIATTTTCLLALSSAKHIRSPHPEDIGEDVPHSIDNRRKKVHQHEDFSYSDDDYYNSRATDESLQSEEQGFDTDRNQRRLIEKDRKRTNNKKTRRPKKKRIESDIDLENELDSIGPTTNDLLAMAQQHAMKVIVEKMLIAFGPEFIEEKRTIPTNISMLGIPTVASPLNITTEHCPSIYAKCSSEIFYSSCDPPAGSHHGLWKQRFNLYFDLPNDLLEESDVLLNGTIRIYKFRALPLRKPIDTMVDIYSYTSSFTKKRDWNIMINSVKVPSDYIGWVTLDVTDWVRKSNPDKNFGFLIKISDDQGFLWDSPSEFFEQRNCSIKNSHLFPVPFGVETEEPKEKFPSLTIHTGMLDHYYSDRTEELDDYDGMDYDNISENLDPASETGDEMEEDVEMTSNISPILEENEYGESEMSKDDPQAHKQKNDFKTKNLDEDELNEANSDDEEEEEEVHQQRHVLRNNRLIIHHRYSHPRQVLVQKPSNRHHYDPSPHQNPNNLSSLEEEEAEEEVKLQERDRSSSSKALFSSDKHSSRIVLPKRRQNKRKRQTNHRHNHHLAKESRRLNNQRH